MDDSATFGTVRVLHIEFRVYYLQILRRNIDRRQDIDIHPAASGAFADLAGRSSETWARTYFLGLFGGDSRSSRL